jgi:hypothetical protein
MRRSPGELQTGASTFRDRGDTLLAEPASEREGMALARFGPIWTVGQLAVARLFGWSWVTLCRVVREACTRSVLAVVRGWGSLSLMEVKDGGCP